MEHSTKTTTSVQNSHTQDALSVPLFVFNLCLIGLVGLLGLLTYSARTQSARLVRIQAQAHTAFIAPHVIGKSVLVWDISAGIPLYERSADDVRPLASITKIMAAVTARTLLPKNTQIVIRKEFLTEGSSGLREGESFSLARLLDLSLIMSSNDGVRSIASVAGAFKLGTSDFNVGRKEFIGDMNREAKKIGQNTLAFTNETGLDNDDGTAGGLGSARDVVKLFTYALKTYPDLLEATRSPKETISSVQYYHAVVNTDTVLGRIPNVIASKTGLTDLAGGNLAVVFDTDFGHRIAIVVLGSTENGRFSDVVALASSTLQYITQ